jgi:hypothetical protein
MWLKQAASRLHLPQPQIWFINITLASQELAKGGGVAIVLLRPGVSELGGYTSCAIAVRVIRP